VFPLAVATGERLPIGPCGGATYVYGVAELEAALAAADPFALEATTVKVYAVPSDKPLTEIGEPELEPVNPPGLDVAVYVTVFPPVPFGVNPTETVPVAPVAVAVPIVAG
jgi:hypothetical protein